MRRDNTTNNNNLLSIHPNDPAELKYELLIDKYNLNCVYLNFRFKIDTISMYYPCLFHHSYYKFLKYVSMLRHLTTRIESNFMQK